MTTETARKMGGGIREMFSHGLFHCGHASVSEEKTGKKTIDRKDECRCQLRITFVCSSSPRRSLLSAPLTITFPASEKVNFWHLCCTVLESELKRSLTKAGGVISGKQRADDSKPHSAVYCVANCVEYLVRHLISHLERFKCKTQHITQKPQLQNRWFQPAFSPLLGYLAANCVSAAEISQPAKKRGGKYRDIKVWTEVDGESFAHTSQAVLLSGGQVPAASNLRLAAWRPLLSFNDPHIVASQPM